MFNSEDIINSYSNLIGWREHHDNTEITINPSLTISDSGEYYQQKHPALRLDIINATLPDNYDINDYLETKVKDASIEMLNDLMQYRHLNKYGKTLLSQSQLLNKYGFLRDGITNQNRFVGYQIRLRTGTGLQAIIREIGMQFSGVESFNLYLFHSSKKNPIETIPVTTSGSGQWDWKITDIKLNSFKLENYNEGVFLLGYYQEDVNSNAINNTDFNWDKGACGSCNSLHGKIWRNIGQYYTVYPFYVPNGSYTKGEMIDLNDIIYINNQSYGLNLKLSTICDLTDFFIQNKMFFKNLLAYKVSSLILNDMKFSQQINYIEENIKMMIIRDLEGDIETKMNNITKKYNNELKAVSFNISGINEKCLPCEGEAYEPIYGVV